MFTAEVAPDRGSRITEHKAVYKVTRTARTATQKNPVSKKKKEKVEGAEMT